MKTDLAAPVCSITTTRRRRFFWAVWLSGAPTHVPFKKPDASDGGAATHEEAVAAATKAASGATLVLIDPLWARAWMRVLRGQPVWPTKESRQPRSSWNATVLDFKKENDEPSIWVLLGVSPNATLTELKAAYRKRALETHPDHEGGDDVMFRRVVRAYEEAQRRIKKPRPKTKTKTKAKSKKRQATR